ncbi:TPA: tRNA-specific adenosine deaminase [Candidatus Latescibacteria bacterium]|nr:tRNA-specific adenosine deaminase [Candidatus Latescibacterota bacterium]|tara:strand:+ start:807 stop:1289 length:483 start_codon:yes stop_codon:yes gene_type:complete
MSEWSPERDERAMRLALDEAQKAAALDEVPVGAVILRGEEVVGVGHNLTRTTQDATAHAEMVAIRDASRNLDVWWLEDCTLYVTLEPCAMCAGGIVLARIDRLVFGATDPKAGACGSMRNVVDDCRLNHRVKWLAGILEVDCGRILTEFFRAKRQERPSS